MLTESPATILASRIRGRWEIFVNAALGVILFFAFFYGLGAYGLLNDNEGLYAEIAREMLEAHSYVIPTLNHVPYIEKPPLLYWLVSLSYWLFGVSETSARLVPASAATLLCLGLVRFGRGIGRPQTGMLAAFVLASSFGFALLARTVMFDMLLTVFIAFTLLSFYGWYENGRARDLRLAYLFLGLAVMTKGLVALALVVLTVMAFLPLAGFERRRVRALADIPGMLLFISVTLPWHLAAVFSDPGFGWFYFINEHVMRFLGRRVPHDYHAGPFYYYVPLVLAGALPWSGWLLLGLRRLATRDPFEKLLLVWFTVFFLFFSAASDKGDYYLVTALPAGALFITLQIERYSRDAKSRLNAVFAAAGLVTAVLLTGWILRPYLALLQDPSAPRIAIVILLFVMLGIASFLVPRESPSTQPLSLVIALSTLIVPFSFVMVSGVVAAQGDLSEAGFARSIAARTAGHPVALYRDFEQISSLLFYLHRPLPVIDSASKDLYYGQHTPAGRKLFFTTADLVRWSAAEKLYVVVQDARRREFETGLRGKIFCRVAGGDQVTLYSNDRTQCRVR